MKKKVEKGGTEGEGDRRGKEEGGTRMKKKGGQRGD